jgi:hypothetical protein
MPKKVYKINNFHGGLNNSSDPRDVDDKEITAATNVMVDEVGRVRLSGSNVAHDAPVIPGDAYGSVTPTQVSGSGLFTFNHDRQGAEGRLDASDSGPGTVVEDGDSYLCLYDDSVGTGGVGPGVFIYSLDHYTWFDAWEDTDQSPIQFKGETTGLRARPCFFSVDGAVRISTGEFSHYDSSANTDEAIDTTETLIDKTDDANIIAGNYIRIEDSLDEIMYVVSVDNSIDKMTVIRGMFGTKQIAHATGKNIYILNMNQWYGYVNNKLFQTSVSVPVYENNKWYNNIQHLRSLDDLGISLILHDATSTSPAAGQINAVNKIVVAYWFTTTKKDVGFWNGTYWIGLTPVYEGGQEGPISTVGTSPLQINEEILNVQLYITHPDIDDTAIVEGDGHPLLDERITGLRLYTKQYTSDEWFLLKEFDLLEGGEHGWETYNSDAGANITSGGGNTLTGFWKTTSTADSLTLAAPSDTTSYGGPAESNTCTATLNLNESKGTGRVGTLRLVGFDNSPLYLEVDLSSTSSQGKAFNVVNPAAGTHKFIVELLDENFNIMARAEQEQAISDSGVDASPQGGSGGSSGSGSS